MYGKIFDSMYEGTLYGHWEAIVTLQQMLVLCGSDGVIDMTPQAIAARTSIPLDIIAKGIAVLSEPDPYTRTPGEDGKRIILIDSHRPWGWLIVNYVKYRDLKSRAEKMEADRVRIADKRKSLKNNSVADSRKESQVVAGVANVAHVDAATDATTDIKNILDDGTQDHTYTPEFNAAWRIYPPRAGGNPKTKAFKAWTARLKQGAHHNELHDGTQRYSAFCVATGKTHTEYVMQASTFYGPEQRYAESWAPPAGGNHATRQPVDNSAIGQVRAANERARQRENANRQSDAPSVGAHDDDVRPPLEG